jgi:hypothetical protein
LQNFVSDFAVISKDDVFSGPGSENLLNQVICKHFYRQGMLEIADELAKVSFKPGEEIFTKYFHNNLYLYKSTSITYISTSSIKDHHFTLP